MRPHRTNLNATMVKAMVIFYRWYPNSASSASMRAVASSRRRSAFRTAQCLAPDSVSMALWWFHVGADVQVEVVAFYLCQVGHMGETLRVLEGVVGPVVRHPHRGGRPMVSQQQDLLRLRRGEHGTRRESRWSCPNCGVVHDRNENAARNLQKLGASRGRRGCNAPGRGSRGQR